jgi:3-hydroxyisobutyrate dehydrogenase-like beta-hydroxyacid dehydrogenase
MAHHIAVLGLGEAGGAIAADLVMAGAHVVGYDPRTDGAGDVARAPDIGAAVREAELVLSINSATAANAVAAQALPAMRPDAVFADLNTGPPELKRHLDALAEPTGIRFADVALMAPVPGRGVATPSLVAGTGAAQYVTIMSRYGAQVELLDEPAGAASARKLLRSIVMKGLAAAILEALAAARAAGCEPWLREDLGRQFGTGLVDRLESGSHQHAARRVVELDAVLGLLDELDVPPRIAQATRDWLAALTTSPSTVLMRGHPAR